MAKSVSTLPRDNQAYMAEIALLIIAGFYYVQKGIAGAPVTPAAAVTYAETFYNSAWPNVDV